MSVIMSVKGFDIDGTTHRYDYGSLANIDVVTNHIHDGAVTTDKIVNGAVTTDKIVNGAVTTDKIVNGAVNTDKITNSSITKNKIVDGAVTLAKLADSVVERIDSKADADGYSPFLAAGTADQLISTVNKYDRTPYVRRRTGGNLVNIGTRKIVNKIVGGSIIWNQLVDNGNFSNANGWASNISSGALLSTSGNTLTVTSTRSSNRIWRAYSELLEEIPEGHVVIGRAIMQRRVSSVTSGSAVSGYKFGIGSDAMYEYFANTSIDEVGNTTDMSGIIKLLSTATNVSLEKDTCLVVQGEAVFSARNVQVFDITSMYGEDIADYIYSLEQANSGAGIAWFKENYFKDYYGGVGRTLMSTRPIGQITRDVDNNVIQVYGFPQNVPNVLRGIPKIDANNSIYYDGDEIENTGIITYKYEEREYESGDENLEDAITDGHTTIVALSIPITEDIESAYPSRQIIDPNGKEEFTDGAVLLRDRDVSIPVGHETEYCVNLVSEIERMADLIPEPPSVDGNYHLALRVVNGVKTCSWEADI